MQRLAVKPRRVYISPGLPFGRWRKIEAMGRVLLALLCAGGAWAQTIIDPAKIPAGLKHFAIPSGAKPLRCDPSYLRPVLNFSLRFQAGYVVRVPMDQYLGKGHWWLILERITPEADPSKAVYMGDRYALPDVPKTNIQLSVMGGYLLGEGRYHVEWMIMDDLGRATLKEWTLEAQRTHATRNVNIVMPPGAVAEFSLRGSAATPKIDDTAPIRLTVLMNAAPMSSGRFRLRANDKMMLLAGVSALLEHVPTKSVRLVVFNLDQQRELYRKEEFSLNDLDQVGQVLNKTELDLVDYHVLQRPKGHLDLLAGLLNGEAQGQPPADVVLVLGPRPHFTDKIPSDALPKEGTPRILYLQYQPFLRARSQSPDTIQSAVKTMRGKTLVIRTPADFARGIEQVERHEAR